jgi:UrcA family protein
MQRLTLGAFVSALIVLTPNIARAADVEQQARVTLSDLDTGTALGADRALHRIRSAAREVCGATFSRQSFAWRNATEACVDDAMTRAVEELGDPLVSARFSGAQLYARRGEVS